MRRVIDRLRHGVRSGRERVVARLRSERERRRWLDHLVRSYERYQECRGDRLAAGITYFAFLSFFPLLALAYALLGYLVGVSEEARRYFLDAINSLLPGLADQVAVEQIAKAKEAAGIIGLVGLLIIGLAWVGALRESLREIWGNAPTGDDNFFARKLEDIAVLIFLGTAMILSVAVSTVTSSVIHWVLDALGPTRIPGIALATGIALRLLALAVGVFFGTLIFLVLFSRLSGTRAPWRSLLRGALFGAVGFEVLKLIAAFLVGLTTKNPVYASFAVVVGLLVWMDAVSRFALFAAAWTATRQAVLSADQATPREADHAG